MRPWTKLLPAFVWLWLVRRHGERMPLPAGTVGMHAGGGTLIVTRD